MKRGIWAHRKRARSGDETETGEALGGGGEGGSRYSAGDSAAVRSGGEGLRIVIAGLRGEDSVAELCRKEGINQYSVVFPVSTSWTVWSD